MILNPDISAAKKANSKIEKITGSILGLGMHQATGVVDPLKKLVRLKDNELLAKDPATFCIVNFLRKTKSHLKKKDWVDFLENCKTQQAKITEKRGLLNGFNSVLSASQIGPHSYSYKTFEEIIQRVGLGDAIELKLADKILETKYSYRKNSLLPFNWICKSGLSFENAAIFCFNGKIEKLSSLHKVLTWAGESKTPIIIAVHGVSDEIRKTLEHNFTLKKLSGALIVPNEQDELHYFSIEDLARLTQTTVIDELLSDFPIEICGIAKQVTVTNGVSLEVSNDLIKEFHNSINETLNDLSPQARAIAERRKAMITGGKILVEIPTSSIVNTSHAIDEISSILSLWSVCLKEQHVLMSCGLQSLPVNTLRKAIMYIENTDSMIDNIGLYLEC
jgi:hypothetical protein